MDQQQHIIISDNLIGEQNKKSPKETTSHLFVKLRQHLCCSEQSCTQCHCGIESRGFYMLDAHAQTVLIPH